jgi:hypothetical protein
MLGVSPKASCSCLPLTASPLRVGFLSGVALLGSILPEPQLGLHAGQQARCDKAVRPASMAQNRLPHTRQSAR